MIKVGFLIAGFKGFNFFKLIHSGCNVSFVSSYEVKGTLDDSFNQIGLFCQNNRYKFIEKNRLKDSFYHDADVIFIVGWQYILHNTDDRFIIFHDSLLPRYRGFSPTVNALINGDKTIGVTALKPSNFPDQGPIYEQKGTTINYPIKLKDVFLLLSDCYFNVAKSIIKKIEHGNLKSYPQDDTIATYSIWLDELDYFVDWNWTSNKISRFVDAVGWPYSGAKTIYRNKEIFIDEVVINKDLNFENRQAGKIWTLTNGQPEVVCGKGMVKIISARNNDGGKVVFDKLRERLG